MGRFKTYIIVAAVEVVKDVGECVRSGGCVAKRVSSRQRCGRHEGLR